MDLDDLEACLMAELLEEGQEGTTAAAGAAAANGGSVTHAPLPGAVPWQAAADTGAGAGAEAEACAEPGEEPAQTIGGLGRQAGLGLKQGLQDEPHVSWQQAQQEQQQELEEQEQQGEGQQEDTEVIDLVNDSGTASEKLQQQHQQAGGGGGAATRRQRRRRRPAAVMADEARQSAVRQDAQVGLLLQHAARQKQPFTPGKRAEPPRSGQRPAAAKRPAPAMRLPAMPAARTPSAHKAPTLSLQQEQPPQGGTKAAAAAAPALGEACGHSLASLREEAKTLLRDTQLTVAEKARFLQPFALPASHPDWLSAEAWAWRLEDLGALAGEASSEELAAHLRSFLPPSAVAAAAQR